MLEEKPKVPTHDEQERTESYSWRLSWSVADAYCFANFEVKVTANDLEMLRSFLDLMKQALDDVMSQPNLRNRRWNMDEVRPEALVKEIRQC